MKEYSWDVIHKDLKSKVYYPVYLLMGEEPFYIDVIAGIIEKTVLEDTEKEFNQTILYGKETDAATIVATAKRFPMMSNHQVVIVKEAQNVKDLDRLESYMANPLQSTLLVLCHKYKSVDKRKTFVKTAGSKGVVMESKKIPDYKMAAWINDYIKKKGYKINDRAGQMLADHLGNDLGKVVNELNKVFISLPKGQEVTATLIEQNIGISKDYNNFEFQAALSEKNALKAFQIVKYFSENPKSNPLVVTLGVLYSHFSKLLLYHSLKDKSPKNVASELKMNPFFVKEIQKAAAKYPPASLFKIFSYLREYDLKSKGVDSVSTTTAGDLLKELTFKILAA